MDIHREPANISFEDFLNRYFIPEIPVILTDVTEKWPANHRWTEAYLIEMLEKEKVKFKSFWYQANNDFLEKDIIMPKIVEQILDDNYSFKRELNKRIWINYKNNLTAFHADGNGIYVFNVQVYGKKHWQLIDPNAPVPLYSFTAVPNVSFNDEIPQRIRPYSYEFDLNKGEMLFLPPYWFHKVTAEHDINFNLNWVGTKRNRHENSLHRREKELFKLLLPISKYKPFHKMIDFLMGLGARNYFENYAGSGGKAHIEELTKNIPSHQAIKRGLIEIGKLPILLKDFNKLKKIYDNNPKVTLKNKV